MEPVLIPCRMAYWGKRAGGHYSDRITKGAGVDGLVVRGRRKGGNYSGNSVPKKRSIALLCVDNSRRYGYVNGIRIKRT